jgi:two-component system chemotaxis response regulator CheB
MIRVLVIDESATMRSLISASLRWDRGLVVVGEAADPAEARKAIRALEPDVVTLDPEMPDTHGPDLLEGLMRARTMPVVVVSEPTAAGAKAARRALELGAADSVAKPAPEDPHSLNHLPEKVRAAAQARRVRGPRKP